MKEEDDVYRQKVISRGLAIIVGLVMFFALPITPGAWCGYDWRLMTPTQMVVYGATGSLFGFLWPRDSWALGLYFCSSWPLILIVALFLGEQTPGEFTSRDWLELWRIFLMFVSACVGAGLGAYIARKRSTRVGA